MTTTGPEWAVRRRDESTVGDAARPQPLIVSIFGRYGRAREPAIQIADLIELMAALGVDAGAVRSAVSRLKQRGVLISDRARGGAAAYRLSDSLESVFKAGDHRIFEATRGGADDPWLLASFSVPESERPLRHQMRKLLHRLGFGQVSGGLWIAPGHIVEETRTALGQAGLDAYVELFLGGRVSAEPLAEAVQQWWDLSALQPLYREFLDAFSHALDDSLTDRAAFAVYVWAITHWRRLVYLDPGIPFELLPADWAGVGAEQLFGELHQRLSPCAERYVSAVIG